MEESGTQSPGTVRWDTSHHRMASCDDHPACRSCLHKMGIFCSETKPCDVCIRWGADQWQKIWHAEHYTARRRQVWADHSDSKTLEPRDKDLIGPKVSTGPGIEASPQSKDHVRLGEASTRP